MRSELSPEWRSSRATEKLANLGEPGFHLSLLWRQLSGFLIVTGLSKSRQHIGEGRFSLFEIPWPERKTDQSMSRLVKPNDDQAVDEHRHGRGSLDGLGKTIGRVFQTQELFAAFKSAFDGPATGIGREDFPRCPIELRTVEHLLGTFPFQIAHQDDGQQSVPSRLVVESLLRLDRQAGVQPKLVEFESSPRLLRILSPLRHARQPLPFLAGSALAPCLLGRCRFVKRSLGMDMADEMNIGGQVRKNAVTAICAIAGEDDLVVRKPPGDQIDEFKG